jgi:hypothetical protein
MPIETPLRTLVEQLRRAGLRPERRLVEQILAHGDAARPELLRLATDTALLHTKLPELLAPLHALRLLGEVPGTDMILPLLQTLPIDIYGEQDVPSRLFATEVSQIIGRIGAPAMPVLLAIGNDPTESIIVRGAAITVLVDVVAAVPDLRTEVIALARELLTNDDLVLATGAAGVLSDLGDSASYRAIMDSYRNGRIDKEQLPPAGVRQLILSGGRNDLACVLHPLWERYDHHGPFPAAQGER